MSDYPCFIDFEASGLTNSTYPIEVAWNLPDGTIRSFLIRREPSWTYWDTTAAHLHGISREELDTKGVSPTEICAVMAKDLAGCELYADGGIEDELWLTQLLRAGGVSACPFRLRDFDLTRIFRNTHIDERHRIGEEAWKLAGRRHRAGNDVRFFLEFIRLGREAGYEDDVKNSVPEESLNPALNRWRYC